MSTQGSKSLHFEIGNDEDGLVHCTQLNVEDHADQDAITLRPHTLYLFESEVSHYTGDVRVEQKCVLVLFDTGFSVIGSQLLGPSTSKGPFRLVLRCKAVACIPWHERGAEYLREETCQTRLSLNRCNVWTREERRAHGLRPHPGWPAADYVVRAHYSDLPPEITAFADRF